MQFMYARMYGPQVIWALLLPLILIENVSTEESGETTTIKIETVIPESEEFAHLLHRISQSRRVHLTSELTRNGHNLQIEEFLDLDTWSQFIQFKWHEEIINKEDAIRSLLTHKVNVIIINSQEKKFLVQYEPYKCEVQEFDSTKPQNLDWKALLTYSLSLKQRDPKVDAAKRHASTIQSILTTAENSPYLGRVEIGKGLTAWVFGITGLWIKAQYPGAGNEHPYQLSHYENGEKIIDSSSWRLDLLDAETVAFYYFDGALLEGPFTNPKRRIALSEFDSINLIELRNLKGDHVNDLINVIDVDLEFSNSASRDLFYLPIGHRCPANPLYPKETLNLESFVSPSKLIEFEVVATKYAELDDAKQLHETDIKSMLIATSKHPLNSASFLSMIQLPEDKLKYVRDFHSRLRYTISSTNAESHSCTINGLHIYDFAHHQSFDPVEIKFKNGITIIFKELFLDFLLFNQGGYKLEYRILNRIPISATKEEYILESEVADSLKNILSITDKGKTKPIILGDMSIVRVYERSVKIDPSTNMKTKTGTLRLMRVILVVLDKGRGKKLAEVTFNLVKAIQPLSFARRAKLFDISKCYDPLEDSIQMTISYPVEPKLVDYAETRSKEMIEEFYKSSIDWWLSKTSEDEDPMISEKRRLALSINFLRVPNAELRRSIDGDGLELRLRMINKASPLYLFSQIVESTFETSSLDEKLFLNTIEQCANYCQYLDCRMFAYDITTHECKLSQVSLAVYDQDDEDQDFVQQIRQPSSTVYYLQARVDAIDRQIPAEEASLYELYSYVEHSLDELNKNDGKNLAGEDSKPVPISEWPLFSFQFTDRSDRRLEYLPPKKRLLVPQEIRVSRVPPSLDFSGNAQKLEVASSFRIGQVNQAYVLNVLDDIADTPLIFREANERTFINRDSSVYYTLRRFIVNDQDSCTLSCYDIDEWDAITQSEQTCISFSYCSLEQQCVLVVKTDFKFVDNVLDLVEEGDRVYSANSIDIFLREMRQCVVATRQYLTRFEGPFMMAPGLYGSSSTEGLNLGIESKWISISSVGVEDHLDVDKPREDCAKECIGYNRDGRNCLALDFCVNVIEKSKKWDSNCYLFVIEPNLKENSSSTLAEMRNQLSNRRQSSRPKDDSHDKDLPTCNRYLASHLNEFHHIKQRKLSQELVDQLESPTPTMNDQSLDTCVFECSIRRSSCVAFEFCSDLDPKSMATVRKCTLYGKPLETAGDNATATNRQVTAYSKDCHIYLRKEIKSLSNLFAIKDKKPRLKPVSFGFWTVSFLAVVVASLVSSAYIIYFRLGRRASQR